MATTNAPGLPWWRRLTMQIVALVLIFAVLPQAILGLYIIHSIQTATLLSVAQKNLSYAETVEERIAGHLECKIEILRSLARSRSFRTGDWGAVRGELERLQVHRPELAMLTLADAAGDASVQVSATKWTLPVLVDTKAGSACFETVVGGKPFVGDLQFVSGAGQCLLVAVPVFDNARHKVIGVLAAELSLRHLLDAIGATRVGQSGYVYVVDARGRVIAHPDFSLVLRRANVHSIPEVRSILAGRSESQEPNMVTYRSLTGSDVFGVHVPVASLGWAVVVEQTATEVMAPVHLLRRQVAGILAVSVLLSAGLALALSLFVARPIARLTQATRQVASGDRSVRIPVARQDDIGLLAASFTQMISDIQQAENMLRQHEHIVSSTTDMLALLDRNCVYLAANAAYVQAFAKTSDEVIGRTVAEVCGEECYSTVIRPRAERCLAGEDVRYQDWFDFPAAGRKFMDAAYSPYLGPDAEVRGFVVAARDITERKWAEEELEQHREYLEDLVRKRTAELTELSAEQRVINHAHRAWL